jgi:hypothetical protein
LQFTRPRSVGVEAVGMAAFDWLGIDRILFGLGFNGVQRAAAAASLIGRMAAPGANCPPGAGCASAARLANCSTPTSRRCR